MDELIRLVGDPIVVSGLFWALLSAEVAWTVWRIREGRGLLVSVRSGEPTASAAQWLERWARQQSSRPATSRSKRKLKHDVAKLRDSATVQPYCSRRAAHSQN